MAAATLSTTVLLSSIALMYDARTALEIVYYTVRYILQLTGQIVAIGLGLGLAIHVAQAMPSNSKLGQHHGVSSDYKGSNSTAGMHPSLQHHPGGIINNDGGTASSSKRLAAGKNGAPAKPIGWSMRRTGSSGNMANHPHTNNSTNNTNNSNFNSTVSRGTREIMNQCPNLCPEIANELGTLIDLVVRDYVRCWYARMDYSCKYTDPEKELEEELAKKRGNTSNNNAESVEDLKRRIGYKCSRPVGEVDECGNSDFMASFHAIFATLLGTLATAVGERVNTYDLILIQYVQTIGDTVMLYRQMRERAKSRGNLLDPQNRFESNKENAIALEFLLAHKLHPALTFRLDSTVNGECGMNPSASDIFHTLVKEDYARMLACELDYLRMVSKHMTKILLPAVDWNSKIVRTLCNELMGGCVLYPAMGMMCAPETLNYALLSITKSGSEKAVVGVGVNGKISVDADCMSSVHSTAADTQQSTVVSESSSLLQEQAPTLSENESDTLFDGSSVVRDIQKDLSVSQNPQLKATAKKKDSSEFIDDWISKSIPKEEEDERGTILPMLTLAVIEVQNYISIGDVEWDQPDCRASVCQLVLAIEAALQHGRLKMYGQLVNKTSRTRSLLQNDESSSLVEILMILTEDLDSFEMMEDDDSDGGESSEGFTDGGDPGSSDDDEARDTYNINGGRSGVVEASSNRSQDIATLRTLIATWLQTGMVYQTLIVFISKTSILKKLYTPGAFFRSSEESQFFVSQLKILDSMEILVDTMALLAADPVSGASLNAAPSNRTQSSSAKERPTLQETPRMPSSRNIKQWWASQNAIQSRGATSDSIAQNYSEVTVSPERRHEKLPPPPPSSSSLSIRGFRKGPSPSQLPKYLTFKCSTDVANRLRGERRRRLESWNAALATIKTEKLQLSLVSKIQRKLAEGFYKTINSIEIDGSVGIISLEVTGNRRAIEVPDVDSSILVRASSRPIIPIAEHRNPRRGDGDYKSYAITYEQAVTNSRKGRRDRRVYEGKYIRRGLLRFYISDRTATIDDPRWTNDDTASCQLPKRFRDLRNPCMKTKG